MLIFQMILAFPYVATAVLQHTDSSLINMLMPTQLLAAFFYFAFQRVTKASDTPVLLEQKQR